MLDKKVRDRAYYLAHRAEIIAKRMAYQKAHKAERLAITYRWRIAHPELDAIAAAKQRCTNPNNPSYINYGGRGIMWRITYKDLLVEIGKRPSAAYSLDRIDNDGHYERGNVRWATRKQQNINRRDR